VVLELRVNHVHFGLDRHEILNETNETTLMVIGVREEEASGESMNGLIWELQSIVSFVKPYPQSEAIFGTFEHGDIPVSMSLGDLNDSIEEGFIIRKELLISDGIANRKGVLRTIPRLVLFVRSNEIKFSKVTHIIL
jgi:hypothetical protein